MTQPKKEKSYLKRIKFDPALKKGFIASYITNLRIIILSIAAIILLGTFAFFNLPKRLNPEVKIPIVNITTILPGASPSDIESLISIPIENEIKSLKGLDTYTSISRDNISILSLQFVSTVNRDKAKDDTQSAVDLVTNLPQNTQSPKVTALDFENQPVWTFALISKKDTASLMKIGKELKDNLENLSVIDNIRLTGFESEEISIIINSEKSRLFNINPFVLSQAVKSSLSSYPAGNFNTENNSFSVNIDPFTQKIEDIRKLKLNISDSGIISLGDIAEISQKHKKDQSISYIKLPDKERQRTITFYVYKTSTANIDLAVKRAKEDVENTLDKYKSDTEIITINDNSKEIDEQFNELVGEFASTILLVFICLFIFLGLRQAIISLLTVPLTFLSSFFLLNYIGMSINFLSLFAFLITLGLLVDDTIVVVAAMTRYYSTKKFTPLETGLLVFRDTIVPIWSTTITTIWSFVPLLISTGIIGEFIKPIPIVVTVTMISSTAIAVFITLPLMIFILKPNVPKRVVTFIRIIIYTVVIILSIMLFKNNTFFPILSLLSILLILIYARNRKILLSKFITKIFLNKKFILLTEKFSYYTDNGFLNLETLGNKYYKLILRILSSKTARKKVVFMIIFYAVFSFSLLPLGLVKNEFFPKTDSDRIFINFELPSGSNKALLSEETKKISGMIKDWENLEFLVVEEGTSLGTFGSFSDENNAAFFTLHLKPEKERKKSSIKISEDLRNIFANYNNGKITVREQSGGPPAGADINIKFKGDNLTELEFYAEKMSDYLSKQAGVNNIEKSVKTGTSKITFSPDLNKLSENNITLDSIGLYLRTLGSGLKLAEGTFEDNSKERKDINFYYDTETSKVDDLNRLAIPASRSNIPLIELGTFSMKNNPTIITREDGKRTISISSSVSEGYSAGDKNKDAIDYAKKLNLPKGYSFETGGANEENQKSINSILQAMGIAFLLILITMVIQFKSYRQAFLVILVIPLAVSSVFLAFALTGTPLSFPAIIGILSLFGIVVTNSMFIVDKINLNLKEGMPFKEAIADSGASRLEPIILTKLSTVLGLLPITLANPLWRGLGGAIISGLLVSSTIMLLFIPVLYYNWYAKDRE